MNPVSAQKALYIKLGEGGEWAPKCFEEAVLRVGFVEVPESAVTVGDWGAVQAIYLGKGKKAHVASRLAGELRQFAEEPSDTLWITFHRDHLYWCFAAPGHEVQPDGTRLRHCIGNWSNLDANGAPLTKDRLHGGVLKTQSYQGTICNVGHLSSVLEKINGLTSPAVLRAKLAHNEMIVATEGLIRSLWHDDFEDFVDLLFRQGGWWRLGDAGGIKADIDLELSSPLMGDRIVIQVKSAANETVYREVADRLAGYTASRRILIVHSPAHGLEELASSTPSDGLELWTGLRLAEQSVQMGLVGWLIAKAR